MGFAWGRKESAELSDFSLPAPTDQALGQRSQGSQSWGGAEMVVGWGGCAKI